MLKATKNVNRIICGVIVSLSVACVTLLSVGFQYHLLQAILCSLAMAAVIVWKPAIGITVLTSGRYLYFVLLALILGLNGSPTITPIFFFSVEAIVGFSLIASGKVKWAGPPTLYACVLFFIASAVLSSYNAPNNPEVRYWVGALFVFAVAPLLLTLSMSVSQIASVCRYMTVSALLLAAVYACEGLLGQLSWFEGRGSIQINNIPTVIGSLLIGSLLPLGLFGVVYLKRPLPTSRMGTRKLAIIGYGVLGTSLLGLMLLTGERMPMVALAASWPVFWATTGKTIRSGLALGVTACVFLAIQMFDSSGRFAVLGAILAQGRTAALSDPTAASRLAYYQWSLKSFLGSPWIGTGLGSFGDLALKNVGYVGNVDLIPHNALLEVALSQGVVGLVPILLILGMTGVRAAAAVRRGASGNFALQRPLNGLWSFLYITWIFDIFLQCGTGSFLGDSIFWFCTGAIWVLPLHSRKNAWVHRILPRSLIPQTRDATI